MGKANRNKPLSAAAQKTNHTISRMRVRVIELEPVFGRIADMGADVYRKIELKRAKSHTHLSQLTYNMDRYARLAA